MDITNLTSYYYHEAALKQTCPSTWRSYWDKYTVATCTHRPATSRDFSPQSKDMRVTCKHYVHTVLSHESSALCSFITDVCSNRRITFRTENTEFIQDSKCLCSSKLTKLQTTSNRRPWVSEWSTAAGQCPKHQDGPKLLPSAHLD